MRLWRGCEHLFNCTRDSHERDAAVKECLDGDLVGCVESDAVGSAFLCRFKGEAQAGEALEVGLLKVKMAERGQIEGERGGRPLRVGQRIQDGQAHVGHGDLRKDRAVNVFDKRVNGGLRVNGDPHLRCGDIEETAGLDNFKALVEHGSRVDGDATAHHPCGVLEGLLGGDVGELVER